MASSTDNVSMALFCDFENVALGVRDANYEKFDIKPVLERLLLKGSIVVKKAYCDWDRYKGFKAPMHEANFELIEIPHVRQSGKNSADIRMVVDALDLCYTKAHVNTFVIISGDSDFSPLVSKLRENAKKVIGVGVKQSTSDLLVANCDEFIFYDDLVRESRRVAAKRDPREAQQGARRSPEEEKHRRDEMDKRRSQAVEMAVGTFDALVSERGDSGKIWASVLKEAIKRRKPDFSESYYGFRTFGNLLEEAKARGLLEFGRDEKSGAYVYRSSAATAHAAAGEEGAPEAVVMAEAAEGRQDGRRARGRGGRKQGERKAQPVGELEQAVSQELQVAVAENAYAEAEAAHAAEDASALLEQAPAEPQPAAAEPETVARPKRKPAAKKPARAVKAAQVKAAAQAAQAVGAEASPWPQAVPAAQEAVPAPAPAPERAPAETPSATEAGPAAAPPAKGRARAPRKGGRAKGAAEVADAAAAAAAAATEAPPAPAPAPAAEAPAKRARKPAARGPRRSGKPDAGQGS